MTEFKCRMNVEIKMTNEGVVFWFRHSSFY